MTVLTAAQREALPDSAYACPEQRLYPHHFADGSLDLPHLRAALSRIGDPDNDQCGKAHLQAHRAEAGMDAKAQDMDPIDLDDWFAGKVGRAVRIIPFGGLIPSADGKGRDLDGEYYDERTDIKPHWWSERPSMWHHGADPSGVMGSTVIGKAINLRQEPDGWWEDLWLNAGEAKLDRLRRLVAKGARLYGSSTPLQTPGLRVQRAADGHIDVWPHAETTLSTSPQNHLAILRPAKAVLDDFLVAGIGWHPLAKAMLEGLADLNPPLGAELSVNSSGGDPVAKAGRVLSRLNESTLRTALEQIEAVLAKLDRAPPNQALATGDPHGQGNTLDG